MSTALESDGMRIRIGLTHSNGEQTQFGMYTGKRDQAQHDNLASTVETWFLDTVGSGVSPDGIIGNYAQATVYLDEFNNPIFGRDTWGTVKQLVSLNSLAVPTLPYQCSVVASILTQDDELPIRRRRNRTYYGPIATGVISTSTSYLTPQYQTGLTAALQRLHADLGAIPVASGTPSSLNGLCTVSYKGTTNLTAVPQIAAAAQVRVGQVIDTQRRRRNALDENYQIVNL